MCAKGSVNSIVLNKAKVDQLVILLLVAWWGPCVWSTYRMSGLGQDWQGEPGQLGPGSVHWKITRAADGFHKVAQSCVDWSSELCQNSYVPHLGLT